jgi:hypothetical protein
LLYVKGNAPLLDGEYGHWRLTTVEQNKDGYVCAMGSMQSAPVMAPRETLVLMQLIMWPLQFQVGLAVQESDEDSVAQRGIVAASISEQLGAFIIEDGRVVVVLLNTTVGDWY